jgi:hypothetical protein
VALGSWWCGSNNVHPQVLRTVTAGLGHNAYKQTLKDRGRVDLALPFFLKTVNYIL